MKSYTVKENNTGSEDSEVLLYKQTDRHTHPVVRIYLSFRGEFISNV